MKLFFQTLEQHHRDVVDSAGEYLEPARCPYYQLTFEIDYEGKDADLEEVVDVLENIDGLTLYRAASDSRAVYVHFVVERTEWRKAVRAIKGAMKQLIAGVA